MDTHAAETWRVLTHRCVSVRVCVCVCVAWFLDLRGPEKHSNTVEGVGLETRSPTKDENEHCTCTVKTHLWETEADSEPHARSPNHPATGALCLRYSVYYVHFQQHLLYEEKLTENKATLSHENDVLDSCPPENRDTDLSK